MNGTLTLRHGVVMFAALLLAAPLVAQRADRIADEKALEQVYLDPALAAADYDAHLKTLVSVMDAAPATIAGVTALRRAMRLEDRCAGMRPLYTWLAARVGDNFKACGVYGDDYCQAYVDLARKYSSDLLWQEVARKWRGVTEWSYIGPFTEGLYPAHDDMFGPEVLLDFAAQYDGGHGTVAWQPVRHYDPLEADVNLWTQRRWPGGGYYLCTALVSDAPREVLLRVDLNAAGKIWMNGRLIADLDTRRREWSEATFNATLIRGRNLLLVKVSTLSSVTALVRAADGGLVEGVVTVAPKAGDARAVIQQGTPPEGNFLPGEAELQRTAGWRGATARSSALAWLALSSLYDAHSLRWECMEAIEHALDLLKDSEPLARLEYLRLLDRSPLHSSSDRRRLRRELTDALLEGRADLLPAVIEKAELLGEDQRYADAVKLLEKAREKAPENWRVTLALADVFDDANWQSEWLRELTRARAQAPTAIPVLRALSRYHSSNQELANRIAIEREVLKLLPGDRDAHIGLCNTLLRTGDGADALKHARTLAAADPGNTGARENLAETLVATGKLDEACAVYEALANESHRPEEYVQKAARACLQLGNSAAAERYFERVLQESPGQHGARRQLQRMRGESEDFWSTHAMAWDEAMKHDVTAEQFPRAGSALVLDEQVQVMYADGSSASYIHQVRKILTQDGVDERGKERVSGELVTARTVLPDGSVLEPIRQSGGLVEFPGVKIGCYIDIAYITRGEPNARATLDGHRFFFSDNAMDEPFAVSRWVLVAPRTMRLTPILHNMTNGEDGVTIETSAEGDDIVRVWDVRNPRHPDFEPFMPPALEFIPWLEFVTAHDWRERARKLADEALGDTRVTGLVRSKATELVEGIEGDLPRARAIYSWVNENFPTRGDAWNAHQALKAGAGDRRELFIALCTAAGLDVGFAYADAAPRYKQPPEEGMARPHWAYPRDEDFTTLLVVVWDAEGKPTYVDLDERLRPFGELSPRLSEAPAILWRNGDYRLIHLPGGERGRDRFENRTTIKLAADGSAKLSGSVIVYGERSFGPKEAWRNATSDQMRRQLERELATQFRGLEVKECRFPDLGKVGTPLAREYDGSVRTLARAAGDDLTLELPGEKLFNLIGGLAANERRHFDMALPLEFTQTDEMRIEAPEGYAFATLPEDLLFPTAPLEYSIKFRMEGGALVMKRNFTIGPGRLTAAEYPDFVEQVKQIREAEAVRIKLVKTQ